MKDWEQLGQNHKALNGSISKMVYSLGAVVACQNNRNSEGKFIKNYPFKGSGKVVQLFASSVSEWVI